MRFFVIFFFFLMQSYAYAQDFIVIVNRDGPLAEADMRLVREVYLGEKRFASDITLRPIKLLPINFTEGALKDAFLKTVVGMSSREYKHHWIKKVFQEGISIPVSMGSPIDIVEFVIKEKGAVAYLPPQWAETIRAGIPKDIESIRIISP
jgi:hypothetical protein